MIQIENKGLKVGGVTFSGSKLFIIIPLITTMVGGAYGGFELWHRYQAMEKKINSYIAPDLSKFDKRLAVIEETSEKTLEYTRDIKNDIKTDLRKLEGVVENVERTAKQSAREVADDVRDIKTELKLDLKTLKSDTKAEMKTLKEETNSKLERALHNPLSAKM